MESWTIVILGATGDLARKKLIPTLYKLLKHRGNHLSFIFVGAAKDSVSVEQLIRESVPPNAVAEILEKFIEHSAYLPIDFDDLQSFARLNELVEKKEKQFQMSGNRLIYLAAPSQYYCQITKNLTQSSLVKRKTDLQNGVHRVVYEKPFGWSDESAHEINQCLKNILDEDQIYRVDHYTTKALTTSIALLRFSNIFFEPVWSKDCIEQIHIILDEKELITGRGSFYDRYGALKDVVQNHIFQLLAYTALERPESLDAEHLSLAKAQVLKHLKVVDGVLGQYEGYTHEPDVQPNSTTETFALLKCYLSIDRWQNVPIFIKTGKGLNKKSSEIHVIFKPLSKSIINEKGFFEANRLILRISPDSGVILRLNIQKGFEHQIVPMTMDFCYRCVFEDQPHSYETLFYDIMHGDKRRSISPEEIHYEWRAIQDIEKLNLPMYTYKPGTKGPIQAESFSKKYGILWYDEDE